MKRLILISVFFLSALNLTAEDLYDYKILDNKDTLTITRKARPLSISGQIAYSIERNSGTLQYPLYPDANPNNSMYPYEPGWGYGMDFGLSAEYKFSKIFGVGLKLSPFVYRSLEYDYNDQLSGRNYINTIQNESHYFAIEPQLIAMINDLKSEILIGLRYEMNYNSKSTFSNSYSNSSYIRVAEDIEIYPLESLLGFYIEIRHQLLTAIASKNNRINISPYISFAYSPKYFETNGSVSANNSIRLGVCVSLGFDEVHYDTLKYEDKIPDEPIRQISIENNLKANDIQGIEADEAKEIDVKIYEPGFAELHPVSKFTLDEETIDYLNDILHIKKNNDGTVIEIKIIQTDQSTENNKSNRKAKAMINYLLEKGVKDENIIKSVEYNNSVDQRIEINIINNN